MATLQQVHDLVRSIVGERQTPPEVYTDAFLLTLSPSVYREIQRRFAQAGVQHLIDVASFNIAIGVLVAGVGTAGWPTDGIIKPIRLWERAQASALFSDYVLMEEADPELIPRATLATLSHWEWRSYIINFLGALTARTVRMQYSKYLADLTAVGDTLLITDSLDAMGYGTAAEAARSRGALDKAKDFETMFNGLVQGLIDSDKSRQEGA
jgi:hypothetical protein